MKLKIAIVDCRACPCTEAAWCFMPDTRLALDSCNLSELHRMHQLNEVWSIIVASPLYDCLLCLAGYKYCHRYANFVICIWGAGLQHSSHAWKPAAEDKFDIAIATILSWDQDVCQQALQFYDEISRCFWQPHSSGTNCCQPSTSPSLIMTVPDFCKKSCWEQTESD